MTEDAKDRFERIVAGVDFSEASVAGLEVAARLASVDNAELVLLHVYSNPFEYANFAGLRRDTSELMTGYVDSLSAELSKLGSRIEGRMTRGSVRHELLMDPNYGRAISDYCREKNADLVVVGTLGKAGLRYVLLGSTAERVLHTTPCSVLTIRT